MSKNKRKQKNALAQFKREFESDESFKGQKIVTHETGEKMSEILGMFIAPYTEDATNYHILDMLVRTAVLAWNAALLDAKTQREFLRDAKKTTGSKNEDFIALVIELMARKRLLFAGNRRFIVSCKVVDTGRGYQLLVVSTLTEDSPTTEAEEGSPKPPPSDHLKNLLDAVFGK